jgi:hypothetical protein
LVVSRCGAHRVGVEPRDARRAKLRGLSGANRAKRESTPPRPSSLIGRLFSLSAVHLSKSLQTNAKAGGSFRRNTCFALPLPSEGAEFDETLRTPNRSSEQRIEVMAFASSRSRLPSVFFLTFRSPFSFPSPAPSPLRRLPFPLSALPSLVSPQPSLLPPVKDLPALYHYRNPMSRRNRSPIAPKLLSLANHSPGVTMPPPCFWVGNYSHHDDPPQNHDRF